MKNIKPIVGFFRMILFAFMFAVCMVLGIIPIVPKRKEQFDIEIKMEERNVTSDSCTGDFIKES